MNLKTKYDLGDRVVIEVKDSVCVPCDCGHGMVEHSSKMVDKIGVIDEISIKGFKKEPTICYTIKFKEGGARYGYEQSKIKSLAK